MKALMNGDYKIAFQELHPLAEQGDGVAQSAIGTMYMRGFGVAQNFEKARYWYKKAAESKDINRQSLARAEAMLGAIYQDGMGVAKDYQKALKWYKKAAKHGDASAQGLLGMMYANGRGVDQDFIEALKWFTISAEMGYTQATMAQDMLTEKMNAQQISKAKKRAREWMENHEGITSDS